MNNLRQHLIHALEDIASHERPDAPSIERDIGVEIQALQMAIRELIKATQTGD